MTTASHREWSDALARLNESPMFRLSLAGKELFHTNFLGWLCESNPNAARVLFGPSFPDSSESWSSPEALRESNNLDLVLKFGQSNTLVVENKVKSTPDEDQLKGYFEKVSARERSYPGNRHFLILTLCKRDLADVQLPPPWRALHYGELAPRLRSVADTESTNYRRDIVNDYANVAADLSTFGDSTAFDRWSALDARVAKLRLHDLVWKRRAATAAASLGNHLKGSRVDPGSNDLDRSSRQLYHYSDFTNGNGLFGCYYMLGSRGTKADVGVPTAGVGVQVQGNQLRSYVQFFGAGRPSAKARDENYDLAARAFRSSPVPDWWQEGKLGRRRKEQCQYGGVFFYRYVDLYEWMGSKEPAIADLTSRVAATMRKVVDHIADFERVLQG